jgi:hypothetical protein
MLKYFWRIRRRFCTSKTTLKSPLSPCTLKDFSRILRIRLNTFDVFSGYDKKLLAYSRNSHKELRIHCNKLALSTWPVPEIIDPVFAKTSQNARFLLSENERFGLVFVKTGSINLGTGDFKGTVFRKIEWVIIHRP